jgi:uncharacterized protein (DUF952 family)
LILQYWSINHTGGFRLFQSIQNFMNTILHITQRPKWAAAKNLGRYRADTLDAEGFIHCSTAAQVIGSANRFFLGQSDLVILVIDGDRTRSEIRYEGADPHNLFPHIYGELNIDAVVQAIDLAPAVNDSFQLPPELMPEL